MKNVYIKLAFSILLCISISCKKIVEIDPPKTKVASQSVFESDATATSAMLGVYAFMNSSNVQLSFNMAFMCGLGSDELKTYATDANIQQLYMNSLSSVESRTNAIWSAGYNSIYQVNGILEGIAESDHMSEPVKKQLTGEALFIRAFWLFYLTNLYGEVPVITSTDYNTNAKVTRQSKSIVYKQIIMDLLESQQKLNENYVDNNSVTISQERIRPNKYVAMALLSRVYLYNSQYDLAEQNASLVIDHNQLYDTVDLSHVFLKNSHEAIWQLQMPSPTNNTNTYDGRNFILATKPIVGTFNSNALHQQFYDAFEAQDERKIIWVGIAKDTSVSPSLTYYYPYKYKIGNSTSISEYTMVLRLAEQYLIRAEARCEQNNLSGAIADLDVIRKRAGLTLIKDSNPSLDKDRLLERIAKERRFELFSEWGHRWLDLKRTGKIDQVMTSFATAKGTTWNSYQQLWPIPQNERNINTNLSQNTGYAQ